MKKLMFAAAAIAAGVAVADVTSANVVGYQGVTKPTGCQYSMAGSMFIAPGAEDFSLADINITWDAGSAIMKNQANSRTQSIQFMASGAAPVLDKSRVFYRCLADGKWYRKGDSVAKDVWIPDPTTNKFAAGTGFLCNFSRAATITFAGEVVTGGAEKKFSFAKPSGCQYFIASNISGRKICINELDITWTAGSAILKNQANSRTQAIQFFSSGAAPILDKKRVYYRCLADGKWYLKGDAVAKDVELTGTELTDVTINAGEAFLCNFSKAGSAVTVPTGL